MAFDLCQLAFEEFCTSFCLIMVKSSASQSPTIHGLQFPAFGFDDICNTCYERVKGGYSKVFVGTQAH